MKKLASVIAALLLYGTASLMAQDKSAPILTDNDVKWGPLTALPKGAEVAVLDGDPSKPGHFIIRMRLPANYVIPPHHHSTAENFTVLSGTLFTGMGDKFDKKAGQEFGPGGFAALPAKMNHFGWTISPTIIQVGSEGPADIVYVNPADDPSKK